MLFSANEKDTNDVIEMKIEDLKQQVRRNDEVLNETYILSHEIVANDDLLRGIKRSHDFETLESNEDYILIENSKIYKYYCGTSFKKKRLN